ncbi:MAG: radical SAM protein [Magnetococcales bacterium]|nr:radical SAM protein [Magnetococcales bacterium]NGZ26401.1 radical SAM protein [Magnetococcales bacterium]
MNIVLIHPYIKVRDVDTYLSEPLGLLCLASYVEQVFQDKVHVSILDLYALGARIPEKDGDFYYLGIHDETYIAQQLHHLQPHLIGITCNFTAYADDSLEVAEMVKRHFPKVPLVMGGAHSTTEADTTLARGPGVDFIVRGEGELIFELLIRHLLGEIPISEVDGLVYRAGSEIIYNRPMPLMKNLDFLPIPNRKHIDMNAYAYFNKHTVWYVRNEPVATIMTSRGCPYNCVFCSTKVVWERNWRPRSLELVFQEIETLYLEYGVREIVINDDQFMLKKSRIHDFCDYFIAKNYDLSFSVDAGISTWLVDVELFKKMRQAGFYSLRFPIESGCEKTLKYIKKPVKLDKTKTLIEEANKLGFWTSSNIIVGFPDETREEVMESIQYVFDSALDFTSFLIAKPQAGSDMYEDFKEKGLLAKAVVRGSDFYRSDFDTLHLTASEINQIVQAASGKWYLHKAKFFANPVHFYRYFLPKIQSVQDARYLLKIMVTLFKRKIMPRLRQYRWFAH